MRLRTLTCFFLAVAFIGAGCEDSFEQASKSPKKKPNLVLIVADTLRQDYLGAYGFSGDVSLAIDRFAARSVLYENAISPAPWTKPSIASILTSVAPEAHGLIGISGARAERALQALNERIPTVASELQRAGYETVALYANNWLDPASGLGRGFDRYEKVSLGGAQLTAQALEALADAKADRPLFLYVHYMDPHGPYKCDKAHYETLRESPSLGPDRKLSNKEYEDLRYIKSTKTPWPRGSKDRQSRTSWRACYAAGIAMFDRVITPLLEVLEANPRRADTAVIFTSDHGEGLLEPHPGTNFPTGWDHGWNLHFHQTRVPMLVRLPEGQHSGMRVNSAVSGLDVAPTLLELAGLSPPDSMQGRSLIDPLESPYTARERWVFSSGVKRKPYIVSVQNHRYKMIMNTDSDHVAIYDSMEDPGEAKNIAASVPKLAAELRSIVTQRASMLNEMDLLPERAGDFDPQVLEELRALGYLTE